MQEAVLALTRETGNRWGEAVALAHLGDAQLRLDMQEKAVESHEAAVAVARESGDREAESARLGGLGAVCRALGFHDSGRGVRGGARAGATPATSAARGRGCSTSAARTSPRAGRARRAAAARGARVADGVWVACARRRARRVRRRAAVASISRYLRRALVRLVTDHYDDVVAAAAPRTSRRDKIDDATATRSAAAQGAGNKAPIGKLLRKYDKSGDGKLDKRELARLIRKDLKVPKSEVSTRRSVARRRARRRRRRHARHRRRRRLRAARHRGLRRPAARTRYLSRCSRRRSSRRGDRVRAQALGVAEAAKRARSTCCERSSGAREAPPPFHPHHPLRRRPREADAAPGRARSFAGSPRSRARARACSSIRCCSATAAHLVLSSRDARRVRAGASRRKRQQPRRPGRGDAPRGRRGAARRARQTALVLADDDLAAGLAQTARRATSRRCSSRAGRAAADGEAGGAFPELARRCPTCSSRRSPRTSRNGWSSCPTSSFSPAPVRCSRRRDVPRRAPHAQRRALDRQARRARRARRRRPRARRADGRGRARRPRRRARGRGGRVVARARRASGPPAGWRVLAHLRGAGLACHGAARPRPAAQGVAVASAASALVHLATPGSADAHRVELAACELAMLDARDPFEGDLRVDDAVRLARAFPAAGALSRVPAVDRRRRGDDRFMTQFATLRRGRRHGGGDARRDARDDRGRVLDAGSGPVRDIRAVRRRRAGRDRRSAGCRDDATIRCRQTARGAYLMVAPTPHLLVADRWFGSAAVIVLRTQAGRRTQEAPLKASKQVPARKSAAEAGPRFGRGLQLFTKIHVHERVATARGNRGLDAHRAENESARWTRHVRAAIPSDLSSASRARMRLGNAFRRSIRSPRRTLRWCRPFRPCDGAIVVRDWAARSATPSAARRGKSAPCPVRRRVERAAGHRAACGVRVLIQRLRAGRASKQLVVERARDGFGPAAEARRAHGGVRRSSLFETEGEPCARHTLGQIPHVARIRVRRAPFINTRCADAVRARAGRSSSWHGRKQIWQADGALPEGVGGARVVIDVDVGVGGVGDSGQVETLMG